MERNKRPVKRRRRYDATGRRAQAERSRLAVLDSARDLFLSDGYAATTIAAIAAAAGVSVETIYKTFGNKVGLVRAIRDVGLAGAGPIHAEQRSDALHGPDRDPRKIIEGWGRLAMEVMPRVAPILLLVRSAALGDPDAAKLAKEMDDDRLRRMTQNARNLLAGGHLGDGVTLEVAADVCYLYSSPELYELLVLRRAWDLPRFCRFVSDAMIAALLPPPLPS